MQNCTKNNKYEDFTIKEGRLCARFDSTKFLDGTFEVLPVVLEPKEYDHLTCASRFIKYEYNY